MLGESDHVMTRFITRGVMINVRVSAAVMLYVPAGLIPVRQVVLAVIVGRAAIFIRVEFHAPAPARIAGHQLLTLGQVPVGLPAVGGRAGVEDLLHALPHGAGDALGPVLGLLAAVSVIARALCSHLRRVSLPPMGGNAPGVVHHVEPAGLRVPHDLIGPVPLILLTVPFWLVHAGVRALGPAQVLGIDARVREGWGALLLQGVRGILVSAGPGVVGAD